MSSHSMLIFALILTHSRRRGFLHITIGFQGNLFGAGARRDDIDGFRAKGVTVGRFHVPSQR